MSNPVIQSAELTLRQQEVLSFIIQWIKTHGYPPSVREIGMALGLRSASSVHRHLKNLETKGFLRRLYNKPRAIEIVCQPSLEHDSGIANTSVVQIPILGRVAAGSPLFAEENLEGTFPLPSTYLTKGPLFLLRVKGDSMIELGILNGDYVLVRQQPIVENGEMAVVLLDNEATVKTFYQNDSDITLRPANPSFDPIVVDSARVLGKVVGVLRFMFSGD